MISPGDGKLRVRRHHHKSMHGCRNCRDRRVKCDEWKPTCVRCLRSGLDCEYEALRAWLFPAAASAETQSILVQPSTAFSSIPEQRAFRWYIEKMLPDITGFTGQTRALWSSVMPRMSNSEPAIRHILIAIASKHEALIELSPDAADLTPLCAKHHSLALRYLVHSQHRLGADILLLSSIAFIFYERMHNPFTMEGRGFVYFQAGLKILRERRNNSEKGNSGDHSTFIDDFLEPMFFQMELVLGMFTKPDRLIYVDWQQPQKSRLELPFVFAHLRTARHAFFHIIALRYSIIHNDGKWSMDSTGFRQVRTLLNQWLSAFDAYLDRLSLDRTVDNNRRFYLREQACLLIGAILYSARCEEPIDCFCRPVVADFSEPLKICITIRSQRGTKVNLSGVNTGTPPRLSDPQTFLWPRAKCIKGDINDGSVSMELNGW